MLLSAILTLLELVSQLYENYTDRESGFPSLLILFAFRFLASQENDMST